MREDGGNEWSRCYDIDCLLCFERSGEKESEVLLRWRDGIYPLSVACFIRWAFIGRHGDGYMGIGRRQDGSLFLLAGMVVVAYPYEWK